MAKFEGNYPGKFLTAPAWFSDFLTNYQFVVKFLNIIGKKGLSVAENVNTSPYSSTVIHNQPVIINHTLGSVPTSVQIQGGRFSYFTIVKQDTNTIRLLFSLLSTQIIETEDASNITGISVMDASLFSIGDSVLINNQIRKVVAKVGSRVGLDQGVSLRLPAMMTLNQEFINLVLF